MNKIILFIIGLAVSLSTSDKQKENILLITTNELHYLNNSQQVRMIFFLSEIV